MDFFRRNAKGGQHFIIIFDIGSSSIGGAFVSINGTQQPEIIFSIRRNIPFQEKLNFQRFLDSMIKTLEEMFDVLQKAGGGVRVDHAFCILASPWYASQTRLVQYKQQTPFIVTEKGLSKLIDREIALFRESKLFARSKVGDTAPVIMESKNIQMKLNGYEARNPYGKSVSELEIALYLSMIPANIFTSINESIVKYWHTPPVHFSSFSFTAFDTIRDIFTEESSFLFIDISGEVTDISLAKNNVLLESISFPTGKNSLIRAIVKNMHASPATAISEMNMYLEGESTLDHGRQIEEILTKEIMEWKIFFEDALSQFATEFPIPRTIFYTADENVSEWFEDAIKNADFSRFSPEDGKFAVRSLGSAFLSKFIKVLEPDFRDPFLAIETIFANKYNSINKR